MRHNLNTCTALIIVSFTLCGCGGKWTQDQYYEGPPKSFADVAVVFVRSTSLDKQGFTRLGPARISHIGEHHIHNYVHPLREFEVHVLPGRYLINTLYLGMADLTRYPVGEPIKFEDTLRAGKVYKISYNTYVLNNEPRWSSRVEEMGNVTEVAPDIEQWVIRDRIQNFTPPSHWMELAECRDQLDSTNVFSKY